MTKKVMTVVMVMSSVTAMPYAEARLDEFSNSATARTMKTYSPQLTKGT